MPSIHKSSFRADGAWGLPAIVLTVVNHNVGLVPLSRKSSSRLQRLDRYRPKPAFVALVRVTTLLATCPHRIEAGM